MSRIFCAIVVIVFCNIIRAQSSPQCYFDTMIYDFGEITQEDGSIPCKFVLTNTYSQPIMIQSVNVACGCLKVDWTKTPIQPYKRGEIKVLYSNKDAIGSVSKKILVYLSNGDMQILEIRGVVIGKDTKKSHFYHCYDSLCLKSAVIDFGVASIGKKIRQSLLVYNSSDEWMSFRFCTRPQDFIDIKMQDFRVPPKSEQRISFDITVISEIYGKIDTDAFLIVNGEVVSKVRFRGSLQVDSDAFSYFDYLISPYMVFDTKIIKAGTMPLSKELHFDFSYRNLGLKSLEIVKIEYNSSSVLKVDYSDITKARRKGRITVTLKHQSEIDSKTVFPVYVYTNSPKSPMVKLMVIGNVQ